MILYTNKGIGYSCSIYLFWNKLVESDLLQVQKSKSYSELH